MRRQTHMRETDPVSVDGPGEGDGPGEEDGPRVSVTVTVSGAGREGQRPWLARPRESTWARPPSCSETLAGSANSWQFAFHSRTNHRRICGAERSSASGVFSTHSFHSLREKSRRPF